MNHHDERAFHMYLSAYQNFEDFIMNGLSDKVISEIIHFKRQSEFICDNHGSILVDYVWRFESLDNSILELSNFPKQENSYQGLLNLFEEKTLNIFVFIIIKR